MRIGSLFSGIGGLELGLERAGVGHTVWQVEIDPFCQQVLAHHWPDTQRFTDVREVGAHDLPPVDVVCGGFPCQDISYAGRGAGLSGARSGLWYEFARIVGEMGPRYVVVENVRALFTRGIDQVLGTLADLGYDAEWSVVSAASVGAPHRRERVFIVAHRNGEREPQRQGSVPNERRRVGDGSGELEHATSKPEREPYDEGHAVAGGGRAWTLPGGGCVAVGDADDPRSQGRGRHDQRTGERATRTAGEQLGQWSDAVPVRGRDGTVRLIPREAAEAGPESPIYPVADGVPGRVARLRAIGNAVVPACAEVVGRRLMKIARGAP